MARFGVQTAKGASNVQSVGVVATASSSPRRVKLVDWSIGSNASPADVSFTHIVQRSTAAPTGSALTPNSEDQADSLAAVTRAWGTVTVDPSLSGSAWDYAVTVNQRASFRWTALPYFELVIPATANYGYMLGLSAVSTTTFVYGILFDEQ